MHHISSVDASTFIHLDAIDIYDDLYSPSVTGEVNCFPRRQLIFSFDRRVIYHLKGL